MNIKDFIPTFNKLVEEDYNFRFTVFTPVYNCEGSINAVYDSLINQSFKDFEWIIINDGSTDGSHEVIEKIVQSSPLNINYINNIKNKHKMGCFIEAIQEAKGEFFLTFDGDDECVPEALEVFNTEYVETPEELKPRLGAITVLCKDQYGNEVGDRFPEDPYYSNTFKSSAVDGITGEKWGFTKTNLLKGIIINSKIFDKGYIPESLIWNLIAKEGYITKYVNKFLRIYHIDVENSISSIGMSRSAFGTSINYVARFNWFFKDYFFKAPVFFLKNLFFMLRVSKYSEFKLSDYSKALNSVLLKVVIHILWPFRALFK